MDCIHCNEEIVYRFLQCHWFTMLFSMCICIILRILSCLSFALKMLYEFNYVALMKLLLVERKGRCKEMRVQMLLQIPNPMLCIKLLKLCSILVYTYMRT